MSPKYEFFSKAKVPKYLSFHILTDKHDGGDGFLQILFIIELLANKGWMDNMTSTTISMF